MAAGIGLAGNRRDAGDFGEHAGHLGLARTGRRRLRAKSPVYGATPVLQVFALRGIDLNSFKQRRLTTAHYENPSRFFVRGIGLPPLYNISPIPEYTCHKKRAKA